MVCGHVAHSPRQGAMGNGWGLPLAGLRKVLMQGSMTSEHNLQSTELVHSLALRTGAYRKKEKEKAGPFQARLLPLISGDC